jgi:hypothetical protein
MIWKRTLSPKDCRPMSDIVTKDLLFGGGLCKVEVVRECDEAYKNDGEMTRTRAVIYAFSRAAGETIEPAALGYYPMMSCGRELRVKLGLTEVNETTSAWATSSYKGGPRVFWL